jgi:hypothetical protein
MKRDLHDWQLLKVCSEFLQDLGRCRLRKNVKPAYGFDADGWQTFWQEDLFQD